MRRAGARRDLLPDSGPQGRVKIFAPQQCVRLFSVDERVTQRGVAGVEGVGEHAGGRLVALPPRGVDGLELFDAVVDLPLIAAQHCDRQ